MPAAKISYTRQFTVRAYNRGRQEFAVLGFVALHPRELARVPRWLRERGSATMALRTPWWPYEAITWVASALPPQPRVFEYGGGGSTLWLEDCGATVTVVEHDEQWNRQLAMRLSPRTRLLFRPPAESGTIASASLPGYLDDYVAAIDGEADGSLDLVVVDGRARAECVRRAMPKVGPGGLLLLDDTNRERYRPAVNLLSDWERHVFSGLKSGHIPPSQTSVWRRIGYLVPRAETTAEKTGLREPLAVSSPKLAPLMGWGELSCHV